jgi:hypothetical protein
MFESLVPYKVANAGINLVAVHNSDKSLADIKFTSVSRYNG